jgi:hypothetical protein
MFQLWSDDDECVRFLTFFLDGTTTEKKWVLFFFFFFFFTAEA